MLSEKLRKELRSDLIKNPKQTIKKIQEDPQMLRMMLDADSEKIKYVKMSDKLHSQLQRKAKQLKVPQGWIIGAGLLLFVSLMDD